MLSECMIRDQFRLRRQLNDAFKSQKPDRNEKLEVVCARISQSAQQRLLRKENCPQISYPDLPVSDAKEDILEAIGNHQVVIIAGETGSGKTTQIPKMCLELGRGQGGLIGHTQPRRLAARSVANRIADELDSQLGDHVGYKVRFTDQTSEKSYIKLMTDGILLAEIQQDRFLNQYDTLIIDEAHERSLNIDFILGYLKQLLPKRPDLKLIITSATIDPERFSRHFDDAPVISVSGRTYPVEMRYRPLINLNEETQQEREKDQVQGIIDGVNELRAESTGDILVFLSGEREIRDAAEALSKEKWGATEIIPLYARLSSTEQQRIFSGHSGRRIILSTNVAETSLTVPGIRYVIDTGKVRISRYSAKTKVQRLPIENISQASANQRAGRCGRVANGICIRLYSEEDYVSRPEFTDPEILRTNLASVILQMLSLGLGSIEAFPFVESPDNRQIKDGVRILEELGGLKPSRDKLQLTPLGKRLAKIPLDPRFARMILEASQLNCIQEIMVITSGLSIQDPRERPHERRQAADEKHQVYADEDSDFIALLNVWNTFNEQRQLLSNNQLRKWCHSNFLNYLRMREWQDIYSQIRKTLGDMEYKLNSQEASFDSIHMSICVGLLSQIGNKDDRLEYHGTRNSKFVLFPGSGLAKKAPKWVVAGELVETSKLYARMVAKIQPQWIEQLASHLVKRNYAEPYWSKKSGRVNAYETVTLFGLTLVSQRAVAYDHIDPAICKTLFIREGLVNQQTKLKHRFIQENSAQVDNVLDMEDKVRRRDYLVDEQVLVDFYDERIPDSVFSESSFDKWWRQEKKVNATLLHFDGQMLVKENASSISELDYPELWQQGNLTLSLSYLFEPGQPDDGVSLIVPLGYLNQLTPQGLDWLVPGMRQELIVALIKGLPKRLRRNFVPAPNYAQALLQRDLDTNLPIAQVLCDALHKMTGNQVEPEDWQVDQLDVHLTMNIKVIDDKGQLIKQGRDLHQLQHSLKDQIKEKLSSIAEPGLEKSGLTTWDFGPLPEQYKSGPQGQQMTVYPALEDQGKTVSISLFDAKWKADAKNSQGLIRLIQLNIPSPVQYLQKKLPNKSKLGLYFNPFGQINALIDDCIFAAIAHILLENNLDCREQDQFERACDCVRGQLNECVLDIATKIEPGLVRAHQINKKLKGNTPLTMIHALSDVQGNLNELVFKGFVSEIGVARLDDWNRYLQGIERRLEKIAIDPATDRKHQLSIEKVESARGAVAAKIPKGQPAPEKLLEVRWLIQELRVSYFAQQLGTRQAISEKRILNFIQDI